MTVLQHALAVDRGRKSDSFQSDTTASLSEEMLTEWKNSFSADDYQKELSPLPLGNVTKNATNRSIYRFIHRRTST